MIAETSWTPGLVTKQKKDADITWGTTWKTPKTLMVGKPNKNPGSAPWL